MRVRDIMTADPGTVDPDASIEDVRTALTELQARHVPVVQRDLLLGIITSADLCREGARAADVMTKDPYTCGADEAIEVVAARMAVRKVRGMPVVSEDGRLVGIVTTFDLLDALVKTVRERSA